MQNFRQELARVVRDGGQCSTVPIYFLRFLDDFFLEPFVVEKPSASPRFLETGLLSVSMESSSVLAVTEAVAALLLLKRCRRNKVCAVERKLFATQ